MNEEAQATSSVKKCYGNKSKYLDLDTNEFGTSLERGTFVSLQIIKLFRWEGPSTRRNCQWALVQLASSSPSHVACESQDLNPVMRVWDSGVWIASEIPYKLTYLHFANSR